MKKQKTKNTLIFFPLQICYKLIVRSYSAFLIGDEIIQSSTD